MISGFGVDIWYGSAASELVVGVTDGVDEGSDGADALKMEAAVFAASVGSKSGRALCDERGVRVSRSSSSQWIVRR